MVVAAVAAPAVSWPDGAGRAEDGSIIAEATVVNLGARGEIATGLPFLDHMIDQLTSHCQLGVSVVVTKDGTPCAPCVDASGDDDEAVAVAAGAALGRALKALLAPGVAAVAAGDVPSSAASGTFAAPSTRRTPRATSTSSPPTRPLLRPRPLRPRRGRARIGTYQTKLTQPFWEALTREAGVGVRLVKRRGDNAHHIVEASFKSFARCLRSVMDQVEGVDVVAMNERLEGVTRASSKARSTKETTIDVALDLDGDVSASAVSTGIATLDGLLADVARERRASDSTSTPRVTSGSTTITPPKTSPSPSGRCSRRRWGIRLGVTAWVARWLPCGTGRSAAPTTTTPPSSRW